jgi:AraC-like DNA-binding protein
MERTDNTNTEPALDYEEWRIKLRSICGQYSPEGVEPRGFGGWVRPRDIYGCAAVDLGCNADRVERSHRDIRLDGMEHYYAVFQLAGRSRMLQNDCITELHAGAVALVDSTKPVTYFSENVPGRWLSLHLPREAMISHFGSEPLRRAYNNNQNPASRLLFRLVQDAIADDVAHFATAEPFMQLAIYDLLGAAFSGSEPAAFAYSDKLFLRVSDIIKAHFTNPGFGPREAAIEAGISLRYLQKLFTARGFACSQFIRSLRLDHAARLIQRRAAISSRQPLSEIAYKSGFSDYTHFSRTFRERFGHRPGAARTSNTIVCHSKYNSAL